MTSTRGTLPIFPLTGVLMLPGTYLPLNVFEERYRNMVSDALEGDREIGMIQPMIPGLDNWGVPPADLDNPKIYPVGCRGRIAEHDLQADGRYHIVLEGVSRFRVLRELEPIRGYRRVEADETEFEIDRDESVVDVDPVPVLSVLDAFAKERSLEFDPDVLAALPGPRLVSTLSAALPFSPPEKQALLEAPTPEERTALLVMLMGIEVETSGLLSAGHHATVN